MRVLHVIPGISGGGIERMLLSQYAEKGEFTTPDLLPISVSTPSQIADFETASFDVLSRTTLSNLAFFKLMRRLVSEKDYDLIHIHLGESSWKVLLCLIFNAQKTRLVIHSHNFFKGNVAVKVLVNRWLTRSFSHCFRKCYRVACSDEAGRWLFGGAYKFKIIRNQFEIERFRFNCEIRRRVREHLGISKKSSLFLQVGRLEPQKNPFMALDVFEMRRSSHDKLLYLGDGSLREGLAKEVTTRGLNTAVKLEGHVDDVAPFIMAADFVLAPSKYEGLGISAMEAYVSGVCLFLSDAFPKEVLELDSIYSISELCDESFSGKLTPRDNASRAIFSNAFADKVMNLGYLTGVNMLEVFYREIQ